MNTPPCYVIHTPPVLLFLPFIPFLLFHRLCISRQQPCSWSNRRTGTTSLILRPLRPTILLASSKLSGDLSPPTPFPIKYRPLPSGFLFCRPHQSPDWEFRLKVSWCAEPLSSATRQIFTLTEDNLTHLKRKPGVLKVTVCRGNHGSLIDEGNRAHLALFLYSDWGFSVIFPHL